MSMKVLFLFAASLRADVVVCQRRVYRIVPGVFPAREAAAAGSGNECRARIRDPGGNIRWANAVKA
jgi:hypothetical protein